MTSGGSQEVPRPARYKILDQRRVWFGQHSFTLNRVEQPLFPAKSPAASPAPSDTPSETVSNYAVLFLSATVYDHQYTVLRWMGGDQELAIVSNVDFAYFTAHGGFVEGDTYYEIIMAWSDAASAGADPATAAWLNQARVALANQNPEYLVVSGTASPDRLQAMDSMHIYFADNGTALVAAYRRQQAENAMRLRMLKLHPPVQPNTVVNFWRIKSEAYPTSFSQ